MRCAIIPPHILEHVASRGDEPELRDIARRSLITDTALRTGRRMAPVAPPAPQGPATPCRTVKDAGHLEELPGRMARMEGAPACGDQAVDQAYDWLGATFAFYQSAYGRNSIDGAGLPLVSTVHYGQNYDNAFWNGSQMVYGDGDGTLFTGFTGPLDVTAHELTHGVTQYTAALDYHGQSGALNESVSDVFGSLVKQFHLGQTAAEADWLIGQGLLGPTVHGVALRSMRDPGTAYDDPRLGRDPQPGHMDQYVQTYRDNGGVHINSGIPNKAFCLAATAIGGYAWDRTGRIWFDALTGGGVAPGADFAAFAAATLAAAAQLYGASGPEYGAVRGAWTGVGVRV